MPRVTPATDFGSKITIAENRKIRDRPLRPILGNQADAIAGLNAHIREPQRDVPHAPNKLIRRYAHPFAAAFLADGVRLVMAGDGFKTETRQRVHFGFRRLTTDLCFPECRR
jgi:hypothetical protein